MPDAMTTRCVEDQRALEMHPDVGGFYWDMADIYEQKKMFAEAFAARQQALSLNKDPEVTAFARSMKRTGVPATKAIC